MPDDRIGGLPDPGPVTTSVELVERLRALRLWAGQPSLRSLRQLAGTRRTGSDSSKIDALPESTISYVLRGSRPASAEFVRSFVLACLRARQRVPAEIAAQVERWHEAWLTSTGQAAPDGIASVKAETGTTAPPRQLPAEPALLLGRERELAHLRAILTPSDRAGPLPRRPRVVVVHGLGGVGKSSLALAAAHAVSADYPDGQMYLDLRDTPPGRQPLSPAIALGRLLRSLGAPADQTSPDVADQVGAYRSMIADRRMLLVLDNAVDAGQVRWLLPGGAGCGVLITSCRPLDTLDGAGLLPVGVLRSDAAVTMLSVLAGADAVARDPAAAAAVARRCGRLPLALRIVGLRAARHGATDLGAVAARLRQRHLVLDELSLAELSVRATFDLGYRHLLRAGAPGQLAAQLFRRLGTLGRPGCSTDDAAALLGVDHPTALRMLELLLDHGLIELRSHGYHLHRLLRCYAAELSHRCGERPPPTRRPHPVRVQGRSGTGRRTTIHRPTRMSTTTPRCRKIWRTRQSNGTSVEVMQARDTTVRS